MCGSFISCISCTQLAAWRGGRVSLPRHIRELVQPGDGGAVGAGVCVWQESVNIE